MKEKAKTVINETVYQIVSLARMGKRSKLRKGLSIGSVISDKLQVIGTYTCDYILFSLLVTRYIQLILSYTLPHGWCE